MILLQIKCYLSDVKKASLEHLSKKFEMDVSIMRDMLSILTRKGQLKKTSRELSCASKCIQCHTCGLPALEFYEWIS